MFTKQQTSENKTEMYTSVNEQLKYLLMDVCDNTANLSNTSALLNVYLKDINWVGFYLYKNDELVLGPFQGMPACTKIKMGNGVCGTAAKNQEVLIVDNVDEFDGHIACDSNTKSEIVLPIVINNKLYGLLDIDSPILNRFDQDDKSGLEAIVKTLIDNIIID